MSCISIHHSCALKIVQVSTMMILLTKGVPLSNSSSQDSQNSIPTAHLKIDSYPFNTSLLNLPVSKTTRIVRKRSINEGNRRDLKLNIHFVTPGTEIETEDDFAKGLMELFNGSINSTESNESLTSHRPEIIDAFSNELMQFLEDYKEHDDMQSPDHTSGLSYGINHGGELLPHIDHQNPLGMSHEVHNALGEISSMFDANSQGVDIESKDVNHLCSNCFQQEQIQETLLTLEPAYPCDAWDSASRTCFLDRNIGDTVTFKLKFDQQKKSLPQVIWKQEFQILHKTKRKAFVIKPDETMWNIVIGSKGYEFRLSPVTEMDVEFNVFTASLLKTKEYPATHDEKKIYFRIRPIPTDLGFVYPGETLFLNMDSYITLPLESMQYVWYIEGDGESETLPSNMKKSLSGSALTISELRKEQEGIVSCSVYTNLNFLIARKRFLIKEIKENDALILPANHNIQAQRFTPNIHPNPYLPLRRSYRKINLEEQLNQRLQEVDDSKSSEEDSNEGFDAGESEDYPLGKKNIYKNIKSDSSRFSDSNLGPESQNIGDPSRQLPPPASKIIAEKVFEEHESKESSTDKSQDKVIQQILPSTQQKSKDTFNSFDNKQTIFPGNDAQVTDRNDLVRTPQKSVESLGSSIDSTPETNSGKLLETESATRPEDKLSKFIAECYNNRQCSGRATCIQRAKEVAGFCRCQPNYQGNGITCWESMSSRS